MILVFSFKLHIKYFNEFLRFTLTNKGFSAIFYVYMTVEFRGGSKRKAFDEGDVPAEKFYAADDLKGQPTAYEDSMDGKLDRAAALTALELPGDLPDVLNIPFWQVIHLAEKKGDNPEECAAVRAAWIVDYQKALQKKPQPPVYEHGLRDPDRRFRSEANQVFSYLSDAAGRAGETDRADRWRLLGENMKDVRVLEHAPEHPDDIAVSIGAVGRFIVENKAIEDVLDPGARQQFQRGRAVFLEACRRTFPHERVELTSLDATCTDLCAAADSVPDAMKSWGVNLKNVLDRMIRQPWLKTGGLRPHVAELMIEFTALRDTGAEELSAFVMDSAEEDVVVDPAQLRLGATVRMVYMLELAVQALVRSVQQPKPTDEEPS